MTSYAIEIKQCPNCNSEFSAYHLNSCNTIDAIYYTDGAVYGPMYSEGSALITCPNCNNHFWREDVPTSKCIKESDFYRDAEMQLLPSENLVNGNNFIRLLHQKFWKTEVQEKYIRIRAWWSYNEAYRGKAYNELFHVSEIDFKCGKQRKEMSEEDFVLSPEGRENLLQLLQLLNANNMSEVITKAEVFRELGQFGECLKLLNQPFKDMYLPIVNAIKNLANGRRRMVGQITGKEISEILLFI